MPEALQRSSANALTETEAPISSLQDLSEQDTLFTFMPKSFRGLLPENPTDPLNGEQDRHRILSRPEALKKTARDAEQINAILADTSTLNILEINFDTDKFCETKSVQPEYIEGMAQKPEFCKENVNPNEHFPNSRIRREGTGRVSSRRPFTLNSSSLGSDINVQKDLSTRGDVFEFFLDDARQEAAAALIRKLRGENSPDALCSQQSLKKRVRRQGTGRRKISKNFDWKLLGDTEKYMFLDDEKLEVEEEDALYSFTSEAERSYEEQRNKECLSETVNAELQYHKDVQFNSNSKICKQAHDQHSMSNVGDIDGRQPNPAQEKETLCASETEETVNMPLKTFVSFGNSTRNAFCELLKDCMKQGVDNTNSKTISKARHEINEIEKSYAKSLDCDTKYALQQSQTESSNTFHSQALFTDEDKTSMQLHQLPKDFHLEVFDKSPCENICQKPMENPTPLTSPTPPSKITAAFLQHKKLKRGIGIKIRDACKPSLEKKDEEVVKVHSSSHSQSSRRPHTSLHSHISRGLHNSSPSHSSSPSQSSRRLHISSPRQRSRRLNTSSPSHISRMLSIESPLEKNQSSGVRRLSFDSSSKSAKQDDKQAEIDSGESPNDVKIRDIVNPSTYSESDKGEMEISDLENSNLTGMRPQQSTPVMVTEVQDLHAVVPEYMEKDILGSASGKRIEEAPVNLHKKNVRKTKTQSKNNSKASGRDAHGKDTVISNEIVPMKRKNKKSDYQRRQSLAGAGTLWKSGVRRSTRIRSRPLEFWRGERFLYGRIHNTLATVIGIKYTSPLSKHEKRCDAPNFKVKSYVDEQYSHLVEFAASH